MPYSGDTLLNAGIIEVDGTNDQGINANYCLNKGTITVRDAANEAFFAEGNDYLFINDTSGTLNVSGSAIGIYARNTNAQFQNYGTINIDSTTAEGVLVRFNALFHNFPVGKITISDAGTRGINVLDNTNTKFENDGTLVIQRPGTNGIHASGNGIFSNLENGNIHLSDITGSGIATSGNFLQNNTSIINQGSILIELPVGSWGIDNTKRFTNDTCGTIHTNKAIRSTSANFNNYGFIHLGNTGAHSITTGGKVHNYGWIEDLHDLLDPTAHTNNNSVIAEPKSYSGCSDSTIVDLFTLGSLSGWQLSGGYADPELTVSAGVLDTAANTFKPNANGVKYSRWYFDVYDSDAGCSDTIRVDVTPICPVICPDDPFFWTGCVDSAWDDPDNWNKGVLPTASDTVILNGLPAGAVHPVINSLHILQKIELKEGAQIMLNPAAELRIED